MNHLEGPFLGGVAVRRPTIRHTKADRPVAVEVAFRRASCAERIALQVEVLRAVGFAHAHVADQGMSFAHGHSPK